MFLQTAIGTELAICKCRSQPQGRLREAKADRALINIALLLQGICLINGSNPLPEVALPADSPEGDTLRGVLWYKSGRKCTQSRPT